MSSDSPISISADSPRRVRAPRRSRGVLAANQTSRDHREYSRHPVECDVWLIDGESQYVLRCRTDDVSDAGLHVTAPIGFGLAIGQRFEARIATPHVAGPMSAHLASSLGYATVIRTAIKVGDHRPDRVGCALQFDVPQLVPA